MTTDYLLSIGIMTGNSLDAADVVLTKFGADGSIKDLDAFSAPIPNELADVLRLFRSTIVDCAADMDTAIKCYRERTASAGVKQQTADQLITEYTLFVANAVNELVKQSRAKLGANTSIDLIGFHGQTCAHQPPSITKSKDTAYTVQIGDGQLLANETGITVVYDFRSDDLMNGGEAAPLAPIHHEHLARHLKARGKFPIAFCNAGNTGNISIITEGRGSGITVLGWDIGPFNNYPDKLMQAERNEPCDLDGAVGAKGRVNQDLLRILFEKGAVTAHGANFLLQPPPKSSDPQWYCLLPEMLGEAPVGATTLSFEDRIRTAEYFAAYIYYYSLSWIPADLKIPACYALCGGGWSNPISRLHFEQLLHGDFNKSPILLEHKELFAAIQQRLKAASSSGVEVAMSDEFGFDGQYMEARIFADAAVSRVQGEPFSRPETSGCKTPTILGIIRYPQAKQERASERLQQWLNKYNSANLTPDDPKVFDGRWSRAVSGWIKRHGAVARR